MNGVHDMGGMHGFGKVEPEPDEPSVPRAWEGRVLAMQRAHALRARVEHRHVARRAGAPAGRTSTSRRPTTSDGRWEWRRNAVEKGLIDADEIAAGHALRPGKPVERVMTKDDIGQVV